MRAIPALIVIALLVAAAVFVADRPGSVVIDWQGWQVDTSVGVLVFAAIVFAIAASLLFWIIRRIFGGPAAFMRARRERRRRDGYRALTQGMVAVAAGDAEEAQKHARKADLLLAEPPLTLLLSAQAAQLAGDERAASRYFEAMLKRAETEFLGLRGLIMQALRAGDEATALHLTERAKMLRPRTPWVLSHLLELQARAGRWVEAEATLIEATKHKALPAAESRHRHAVRLHEHSRLAEAKGATAEAVKLEARANGLEPGFAPVAVRYAQLLQMRGQTRPARKAIEAAWRIAPHPELAEAWRGLSAGETALARLEEAHHLPALNPSHVESRLALARAALDARLWGEARRHLADSGAAADEPLAPRLCRMMAELEEAESGNPLAARSWLARAATTMALDPAYVCTSCGAESAQWTPLCLRCRSFDGLVWRESGRAPALPLLAPAGTAAPVPLLPGSASVPPLGAASRAATADIDPSAPAL